MKTKFLLFLTAIILSACNNRSEPEIRYVAVPPGYTVTNAGEVVPIQAAVPQAPVQPQAGGYYPQQAPAPQAQEDHTLRNAAIAVAAGAAGAYAVNKLTQEKSYDTSRVTTPSHRAAVVKPPVPVAPPVAKTVTPPAPAPVTAPVKPVTPNYQIKQDYVVKQATPTYQAPPKPVAVPAAKPAPSKITYSGSNFSSKKKK